MVVAKAMMHLITCLSATLSDIVAASAVDRPLYHVFDCLSLFAPPLEGTTATIAKENYLQLPWAALVPGTSTFKVKTGGRDACAEVLFRVWSFMRGWRSSISARSVRWRRERCRLWQYTITPATDTTTRVQRKAITLERRAVSAVRPARATPAMELEIQEVKPIETPRQTGLVYSPATTVHPTVFTLCP